MSFALTQAIESCVSGDAVQPAAHGFGIAQRIAAAIGAEKRLLGQVFGLGGISRRGGGGSDRLDRDLLRRADPRRSYWLPVPWCYLIWSARGKSTTPVTDLCDLQRVCVVID